MVFSGKNDEHHDSVHQERGERQERFREREKKGKFLEKGGKWVKKGCVVAVGVFLYAPKQDIFRAGSHKVRALTHVLNQPIAHSPDSSANVDPGVVR